MKAKAAMASAAGLAVAALTTALTVGSGGVVSFGQSDRNALDQGISNALQNLWAGFVFILPYLGVALGVMLVIGLVFFLTRKAGGAARG